VPRFKFHFRVTAGRGGGYGGGYFFEMQFYDRPLRRAEDDKGYAVAGQVLLVGNTREDILSVFKGFFLQMRCS